LYGYLLELSTNLTMASIMAETCSCWYILYHFVLI
jgi:hypothetical protein